MTFYTGYIYTSDFNKSLIIYILFIAAISLIRRFRVLLGFYWNRSSQLLSCLEKGTSLERWMTA